MAFAFSGPCGLARLRLDTPVFLEMDLLRIFLGGDYYFFHILLERLDERAFLLDQMMIFCLSLPSFTNHNGWWTAGLSLLSLRWSLRERLGLVAKGLEKIGILFLLC
jgi:hypothetical protein